jgi:hypothetical protein
MKPHKHKDLIIAWANGALIEYRQGNVWLPTDSPWWEEGVDYRIEPEPRPDEVFYCLISACGGISTSLWTTIRNETYNLCLTFDGETGKLKAAEVLNG